VATILIIFLMATLGMMYLLEGSGLGSDEGVLSEVGVYTPLGGSV